MVEGLQKGEDPIVYFDTLGESVVHCHRDGIDHSRLTTVFPSFVHRRLKEQFLGRTKFHTNLKIFDDHLLS